MCERVSGQLPICINRLLPGMCFVSSIPVLLRYSDVEPPQFRATSILWQRVANAFTIWWQYDVNAVAIQCTLSRCHMSATQCMPCWLQRSASVFSNAKVRARWLRLQHGSNGCTRCRPDLHISKRTRGERKTQTSPRQHLATGRCS